MIYLHKILPLLISPIVLVLGLIFLGVIKKRTLYIIVAFVILYLSSTPIVSSFLLNLVESKEIKLKIEQTPQADAVVVLSGTLTWVKGSDELLPQWGHADRFFAGLDLMKFDHAHKIIFTAGKLPWDQGNQTEGGILKKYAELFNIPSSKIFVTREVQNTEQEANEVEQLLRNHKIGNRIILVTSAFHMQRAKSQFEHVGLNVSTYPVDFKVSQNAITPMSFLPQATALSMTDLAIREVVGRLFYLIKNKFSSRI